MWRWLAALGLMAALAMAALLLWRTMPEEDDQPVAGTASGLSNLVNILLPRTEACLAQSAAPGEIGPNESIRPVLPKMPHSFDGGILAPASDEIIDEGILLPPRDDLTRHLRVVPDYVEGNCT